MGRYEWEAGTIVLPPAAVPGLRSVLNEVVDEDHRLIRAEYAEVRELVEPIPVSERVVESRRVHAIPGTDPDTARRARARMTAEGLILCRNGGLLTVDELEREFPVSDEQTSTWCESDFTLTLVGECALEWDVPNDSWARSRAENTVLMRAALEYLGTVVWTAGTGGVIVGNDECNGDHNGPGADYITRTFGPVGERARIG